jgi:hypothetical protein
MDEDDGNLRPSQDFSFEILQTTQSAQNRSFASVTSNVMMTLLSRPLDHPYQSLILVFALWKGLLFLVALSSPGIGYDTSTNLLLHEFSAIHDLPDKPRHSWFFRLPCDKLARWDAVYFAKIAERGYLFEQEWAFSGAFAGLVGVLAQCRLQILTDLFTSLIVKALERLDLVKVIRYALESM